MDENLWAQDHTFSVFRFQVGLLHLRTTTNDDMNLAAVLADALNACGVPDSEMTVQIIESNGVDMNSLIEQVILSDEGLIPFGLEPSSSTSNIFRDFLIQALAAQQQQQQQLPVHLPLPDEPFLMQRWEQDSPPTTTTTTTTTASSDDQAHLTWTEVTNKRKGSRFAPPPPPTSTMRTNLDVKPSNYPLLPSSASNSRLASSGNVVGRKGSQQLGGKQGKIKHSRPNYSKATKSSKGRKITKSMNNHKGSSKAHYYHDNDGNDAKNDRDGITIGSIVQPHSDSSGSGGSTASSKYSEIEFLASMFDVSLSVVTDVYNQSNQSIEKSVSVFVEILNTNPNTEASIVANQSKEKCREDIHDHDHNHDHDHDNDDALHIFEYDQDRTLWPEDLDAGDTGMMLPAESQLSESGDMMLPAKSQLSGLFPMASASEISIALSRFSNDLELAAAHLMNMEDVKKIEKKKRQAKQLRKLQQVQSRQENKSSSKTGASNSIRVVLPQKHRDGGGGPSYVGTAAAMMDDGFHGYANEETESVEYLHSRMEDCFRRAAQAWSNGQTAHAGILSEDARKFRKRRKLARERDAAYIFQQHNQYSTTSSLSAAAAAAAQEHGTSLQIDLHGLHQSEAIQRVHQAIQLFRSERSGSGSPNKRLKLGRLDIVTGRGIHSNQGRSKLMPAVQRWLQQQNISHEVYQSKGFIRAKIKL